MERSALDQRRLRELIFENSTLWRHLIVVERTGSTNADLIAGASQGEHPLGTVLVAEEQFAGRGRLDRAWQAPPRSGLAVSLLFAKPAQFEATLIPLLVGVAAIRAVRETAGLPVPAHCSLKWPNDLLVGERKLGGILTHQIHVAGRTAIVAGLGLNVSIEAEELPTPQATSLLLEAAPLADRSLLLVAFLRHAEELLLQASPDELIAAYTEVSSTLGREVRIELEKSKDQVGIATGIDRTGALQLADGSIFTAGDVVHLR